MPALQLPAARKWIPVTGKNPDQAGSVRARSKTRGRCCVLRAGALDCAQLKDASTTAEPGITGETVKESCARMADRAWKISSAAHRETRKARKDAMPHERGLTPELPSEFSLNALADRKIRFRRELPATRTSSKAAQPDLGQSVDLRNQSSLDAQPRYFFALAYGRLRLDHASPLKSSAAPDPGGAQHDTAETRNLYRSASRRLMQVSCRLLDLDGRDAFKLLLDGFRFVLGRVLFQRLGSAVNQVLCFLQAQGSDLAYRLDRIDLIGAGVL